MDFIVRLPSSEHWGKIYNTILMIMNHYMKMAQYIMM